MCVCVSLSVCTNVSQVNGEKLIPVAIAAGGGGLGLGHFVDTGLQHGQAINMSRPPVTGNMYGPDSAGILYYIEYNVPIHVGLTIYLRICT